MPARPFLRLRKRPIFYDPFALRDDDFGDIAENGLEKSPLTGLSPSKRSGIAKNPASTRDEDRKTAPEVWIILAENHPNVFPLIDLPNRLAHNYPVRSGLEKIPNHTGAL